MCRRWTGAGYASVPVAQSTRVWELDTSARSASAESQASDEEDEEGEERRKETQKHEEGIVLDDTYGAKGASGHAHSAAQEIEDEERIAPLSPIVEPQQQPEVDVGRALDAVFAHFGWQHLAVQRLKGDAWAISGAGVLVKHDALVETPRARGFTGPPYRLVASDDHGRSWEALEALIKRRRLHKVVRAVPIATGIREYCPEPLSPTSSVAHGYATGPAMQSGGSLLAASTQLMLARRAPSPGPQTSMQMGLAMSSVAVPLRQRLEAGHGACVSTPRQAAPLSLAELAASAPQAPVPWSSSGATYHQFISRGWSR
mmetsp:Transcript_63984/g.208052  ORF Transcript_63984/g.208052 Transcript_63984/m.208052 type:complete len:315 (+) Transcript_63984:541-1485(+)